MREHGIFYNKLRATIHLDRLVSNWKLLNERGGNGCAVIKSDAYGHGLGEVGRALVRAGARDLAVGTVEEGVRLLEEISGLNDLSGSGQLSRGVRVICLLGPQDEEDMREAVARAMVCFVCREDQLRALAAEGVRRKTPARAALKFDTGMSRLGFAPCEGAEVGRLAASLDGLEVVMAASHLAVADDPDGGPFVREQAARLARACDGLRAAGHTFQTTLANSAALLAYPETRLDMQRPGIAMYGANPFAGTRMEQLGAGVRPAMDVRTPVLQVHDVKAGETVSYGRTFRAERDLRVAVLGAGYADCWSRGLSGRGQVCINGRRAPVLGRVCMQMCVVDVTDTEASGVPVRAGDDAWLLGGPHECAVAPEELADWWNTITYEVFCLLGLNRREYVGGQDM